MNTAVQCLYIWQKRRHRVTAVRDGQEETTCFFLQNNSFQDAGEVISWFTMGSVVALAWCLVTLVKVSECVDSIFVIFCLKCEIWGTFARWHATCRTQWLDCKCPSARDHYILGQSCYNEYNKVIMKRYPIILQHYAYL